MMSGPRVVVDRASGGAQVQLLGLWTAAQITAPGIWAQLAAGLQQAGPDAAWDLSHLQRMDHLGAQMLWNHWGRALPAQLKAGEDQRAVLERVARFSIAAPPRRPPTMAERLLRLGEGIFLLGDHVRDLVALIGQLLLDLLRLARAPRDGPWRDITGNLYQIGATALPITAMVGFLIGVVLAYLTAQQLRLFGAEVFIVNILGLSLIRELGPVLAAVLIAGRSGLAIAMPLISLWTTLAALIGGMLSADLVLGITPAYFITNLPAAVQVSNLSLAMGKSVVFGTLIALVGCHFGLRVKPNTESLGRGTTASVVTSITVVILIDALFAVIFKNIGI